jgi:hypothetical protein
METQQCLACLRVRPVEEFNFKDKLLGKRHARCRDCTRAQVRSHYRRNTPYYLEKARTQKLREREEKQEFLIQYLLEHPCVECGESDIVCLDFDHVRGEKVDCISRMVRDYSLARIKQELAKCEVRCAHCHRRKTAHQRGFYRGVPR